MTKQKNVMAMLGVAASNLIAGQAYSTELAQDANFGFRHHIYDEDGLPESLPEPIEGEPQRYDIRVNQFLLVTPIGDSMDVSISYQNERMSGASPWFTILGEDGEVVQVMSGPTIEDERTDVASTLRYKSGANMYSVNAAISSEDDYFSRSIGLGYAWTTPNKLSTWSVSADVSNDDLNPVDADIYQTRPANEVSKRSTSALASYSHILNKNTLLQLSAGYTKRQGFLSDPYKVVLTDIGLVSDNRPQQRIAKTLAAKLRYFVDASDAALHVDYRYYNDDWDVGSHTFDIAWYQNLPYGFQLVPSLRHYAQTSSFFYEGFYLQNRADGFYSTDYRLSEYGATTYGLALNKRFTDWSVTASYKAYKSGASHGLANAAQQNPALLDFTLIQVGFNYIF